MTNRITTRFTGLLRGLLRRFEYNEANGIANLRPVAATAPLPETTTVKPVTTTAPAPVATVMVSENPNELALPLQAILATLPMELRAKIMQTPPPSSTFVIAVEKVLAQLATGSVKITFGELRLTAPGLFVNSGGEFDSRPVTLPLNEILSRLNPAMLARRAAQKQVEVADDIAGPFDGHSREITFTTSPLKPAAPATPPPLSRLNQPVVSTPVPPPLAPPPVFFSRAVTPAPAPATNGSTPHNGNGNGNGNGHGNGHSNGNGNGHVNGNGAPSPVFADRNAPPAIPSFHGAPPIPIVSDDQPILAPLSALMEGWPEGLKLEIATGRMQAGSRVDFGRIGLGVVVPAASIAPDVSTAAALKQALLGAASIAYTDPKLGGTSYLHLMKLAGQFGIADAITAKGVAGKGGDEAVSHVAEGRAALAVVLVSEIHTDKVKLVGLLPEELQLWTVYAAAIPLSSKEPAAAAQLIAALTGPAMRERWQKAGWQPAK